MANFESPKEINYIKTGGVLAILCGIIPLIIIISIYGGAAFLLLIDETSLLLGIIDTLYNNLYPYILTGVGALLILFVLFGFGTLAQQQKTRTTAINVTLAFLVINILMNLASYFISTIHSSIRFLIYWAPFGMIMDWNELLMNPALLVWAVFATVITLGAIISFGYLLLTLNKDTNDIYLKLLAIIFLIQSAIYVSQFVFSLNLSPNIHQQIIFWIFLCGFLISCLFILMGLMLHRKPDQVHS
ncbi:MAG TPA: hypothetical protein VMV49_02615 [Candidatus Deferrimicrobium sp.]|nr:hypothetical protein [Candidatus Deferrimicrobium sp.]